MKERKLTEKERRRKEKFDALCEEMAESGYSKTDLTVGIVAANLLAFVIMAPFMALALILFFILPASAVLPSACGSRLRFFRRLLPLRRCMSLFTA